MVGKRPEMLAERLRILVHVDEDEAFPAFASHFGKIDIPAQSFGPKGFTIGDMIDRAVEAKPPIVKWTGEPAWA
jgi:hypothetical protein